MWALERWFGACWWADGRNQLVLCVCMAEISKSPLSKLSNELAHHPAARQRITREMKVGVTNPTWPWEVQFELTLCLFSPTAQERRRGLGNHVESPCIQDEKIDLCYLQCMVIYRTDSNVGVAYKMGVARQDTSEQLVDGPFFVAYWGMDSTLRFRPRPMLDHQTQSRP